jgi:hypothetical protein
VKFTDPGGRISVSCSVSENAPSIVTADRDGPFVVFEVADTGTGIEADQLERIFDPFTQAETVQRNPYTRGSSGTGLGLTISRRLARLMGGELTVESTPGKGSVFTLWMPMVDRRATPRSTTALSNAFPVLEGARDEVVAVGEQAPIAGLANIAEGLLRETQNILRAFVERVRGSPRIPSGQRASQSQIEDHMATFVADVSIGLRMLEIAGGDPSDLLRDSSAIMRTIMEQHGSQRFRLDWSEEAINVEMNILRDVTCEAIRRVGGASREEADRACSAVEQFIAQATRHTIASYRFSAASLQLGAMRR